MHWYESFVFGRVASQAAHTVGNISTLNENIHKLSTVELNASKLFRDRVWVSPPLTLSPGSLECWVIFTDGACEGDDKKVGSVGGPAGKCRGNFGSTVSEGYMVHLLSKPQNPIHELETLPVLIAMSFCRRLL